MGIYDSYLQANQAGINAIAQSHQLGVGQPTAIERFMQGLQGGQERQRQQKAASLQELLNNSLIKQREAKAIQDQNEFANQEEVRNYNISQRPIEEEKARLGIEELKARLMPKPVAPPIEDPLLNEKRAKLQAETYRLQHPVTSGGGGSGPVDKSLIPGTIEFDRVAKMGEKFQEKSDKEKNALFSTEDVISRIDKVYNHPGRKGGTGASSFLSKLPGTDWKSFAADLETLKSQFFVPAVQNLRGLGALSDAEGKKLTDSVAALDPNMKEEDFANELQSVKARIQRGYENLAALQQRHAEQAKISPLGGTAPKMLSPQEASRLPKGTKFIGLDGVERTVR